MYIYIHTHVGHYVGYFGGAGSAQCCKAARLTSRAAWPCGAAVKHTKIASLHSCLNSFIQHLCPAQDGQFWRSGSDSCFQAAVSDPAFGAVGLPVALGDVASAALGDVASAALGDVASAALGDVASAASGDVASAASGDVASAASGDVASGDLPNLDSEHAANMFGKGEPCICTAE